MNNRNFAAAIVAALGIASSACSREAPPPSPSADEPALTPAAGAAAPGAPAPRCVENFRAFDDDGDGHVGMDEFTSRPHFRADPAGVFRARDGDGDGKLTEREFCSDFRRGPGPAAGQGDGMGPRAGQGPGWGRRRLQQPLRGAPCERHFAGFDADGDGKVTRDEFLAWPHPRGDAETIFGERDRDHDGVITQSELCDRWQE